VCGRRYGRSVIGLVGAACFAVGLLGLFAAVRNQRGWRGWDRRERIIFVMSGVLALGGAAVRFLLW